MGKYTDTYERITKDRYITPLSAVTVLGSYFDLYGLTYIEPCTADGQFKCHMSSFGAHAVFESGIDPEIDNVTSVDALSDELDLNNIEADAIVTNPPWRRDMLHPMIVKFSDAKPTLLLFDANWINTKQASIFKDRLVAVFPAFRHKWFAGTELDNGSAPKEDTSWYLFAPPAKDRLAVFVFQGHYEVRVSLKEVCANLKRTGKFVALGEH